MNPAIIAIACATPPHSTGQRQAARFAVEAGGLTGDDARFAEIIYRRSGIDRRASCLLDETVSEDAGISQRFHCRTPGGAPPTTGERMNRYAVEAVELAAAAARSALKDSAESGVGAEEITHVITVSCTGFLAPGIDHALIDLLPLRPTVGRLHIGYMGCHGAINALAAARSIVRSEPTARVLIVCVELCSLHFQASNLPGQIIANALFADGAAAVVVGTAGHPSHTAPGVAATGGCVFGGTADSMSWRIGDHGFEMTLGESVPRLIGEHLRPWLAGWLDNRGTSLSELVRNGAWAVHPGGPRVLDAVAAALGLGDGAMRSSREVLAAHGNMSSPTVLFILRRLLQDAGERRKPVVMLAFGPGLSVEAALLTL